jgi:hypothetical protein
MALRPSLSKGLRFIGTIFVLKFKEMRVWLLPDPQMKTQLCYLRRPGDHGCVSTTLDP